MDQTTKDTTPSKNPNPPVTTDAGQPPQTPTDPGVISRPAHPLIWLKSQPAIAIIVLLIIGLVGGVLVARLNREPPQPATPEPTPTTAPTPTPVQPEIPLATTSAFLELRQAIQDTKTAIDNYNTSDPSLSPPVLDLPLGFK